MENTCIRKYETQMLLFEVDWASVQLALDVLKLS